MSDFDEKLKGLLSAEDEALLSDELEQPGYHAEMLASFKGPGSALRIGVWVGVAVACAILFFSIWQFFHVDTTRDQIMYASLAIMTNSAQIAFKNWFNQRLNRRAVLMEIRRLRVDIARTTGG